jgi:hypothetical protein
LKYPDIQAVSFNYKNIDIIKYFDENQDKYETGLIDMLSIYYYFEYKPELSVINKNDLNTLYGKKYKFSSFNPDDYKINKIVKQLKYERNVFSTT